MKCPELIFQLIEILPRWLKLPVVSLISIIRPRLGRLNYDTPRKLFLPGSYYKKKISQKDLDSIPIISIVTPSLNQGIYIEDTIQSILEQKYPKLEYIIVDGGSSDGTMDIIKRYKDRLHHVEFRQDSSQANAINRGFKRCSGEIMAWINSDDMLMPGALDYIGDFFLKNPEVDVVYGHRILIDEKNREINRWVLPSHCNGILKWRDYVPQESLFWRRAIWDKTEGKIDETLHFAIDWDLILRFQQNGAFFFRLPRFLGAFRVHREQKTRTELSRHGHNEMNILRKKNLGREPSNWEIVIRSMGYLMRHQVLDKLYRFGILRY